MATEMVRIAKMNDNDRAVINMLSPEERLIVLRQAGQEKAQTMNSSIKQTYQETLKALASGTLQPRTDFVRGYTVGERVCHGESDDVYEWLGVVPGFEGKHLLRREGKAIAVGGGHVRKYDELYIDPLGFVDTND